MPIHLPVLQRVPLSRSAAKESAVTDCNYCRAPCCQLLVELHPHEIEKFANEVHLFSTGPKKILARREEDGYCVYFVHGQGCSTYDDKPIVCNLYSCREDDRITKSDKYGAIKKRVP